MDALRNRVFLTLTAGAAALLAASAALLLTAQGELHAKIILHFDGDRGITRFGAPEDLWWILGVVAAGALLDTLIAAHLFRRDRVLSHVLSGAALVLCLFLLIAVGTIISVN